MSGMDVPDVRAKCNVEMQNSIISLNTMLDNIAAEQNLLCKFLEIETQCYIYVAFHCNLFLLIYF